LQAPCHGWPWIDISVGVQSKGPGQTGVPLMIHGFWNSGGGGVLVHTPCHGLLRVKISMRVQVKPVGQLGDSPTTQLDLGGVVVTQFPRQFAVWHAA
jgi:hypothetical protein